MKKIHVQYTNKRVRRRPDRVLAELIDSLAPGCPAPMIVSIGGPGGCGKSTLAGRIQSHLKTPCRILGLDDYKTSRQLRSSQNIFGPHPRANDLPLIKAHLVAIQRGEAINKPVYNKRTGRADRTKEFIPRRVVIVEGEIATYRSFRKHAALSIFVDAHWETQLKTRLSRDIRSKGYDMDKAVATFLHSNLREFRKYGADSKQHSDIHVYCDEDFDLFLESIEEDLFKTHCSVFEGTVVPLPASQRSPDIPVPWDAHGQVDIKKFDEYLNALFHHGVHRIMIGHFCGEGATLTGRECKLLVRSACEYFPGEVTAYLPAENLADTSALVRDAAEYGCDRIVVDTRVMDGHYPASGIRQYQNTLATIYPQINFSPPSDLRLTKDPLRAKRKAGGLLAGFPLTVRPPFSNP